MRSDALRPEMYSGGERIVYPRKRSFAAEYNIISLNAGITSSASAVLRHTKLNH